MSRRSGSIVQTFLAMPWWSLIFAGVAGYIGMAGTGMLMSSHDTANRIRIAGLIWLGLCGALALISALHAVLARRQFRRQSDFFDIRSLPGQQFEIILGEAFRRRGYTVVDDGGERPAAVDQVLRKDGATFLVQYKQWRTTTVGVQPLRALLALVHSHGASGGIFVTSGTYTSEARALAKQSGIELIDGRALAHMAKQAQEPQATTEHADWIKDRRAANRERR